MIYVVGASDVNVLEHIFIGKSYIFSEWKGRLIKTQFCGVPRVILVYRSVLVENRIGYDYK